MVLTRPSLLFVLCLGCPPKVPDHLRLDPPDPGVDPATAATDVPSALGAMLGSDPLARSPQLRSPASLRALEGGAPLAAYVEAVQGLERGEGQVQRSLQQLEEQWRGTAAVALARGYRLRIAENLLANSLSSQQATEARLIELLTPLSLGRPDDTLPRTPLSWLTEPRSDPDAIRDYADRWVLQAWLVHPDLPAQILAPLLEAPQYDGLLQSPMGQLVWHRASAATAPEGIAPGMADLTRATGLALQRAAADRDREQAAWAEVLAAEAEATGDPDPIGFLLERSRITLTEAAGDPRAAGGALLALTAHRWTGGCASTPCAGLDRVETMSSAGAWHAELAPLARLWRVIALKEALDTLEVGHDTAMFPAAAVSLVDALLGTGAGPLDGAVLRKRRPDPAVWLAVSRSVGTEGVIDWEGAREAIGRHLLAEVEATSALISDEEIGLYLQRIGKRAIP